MAQAEHPLLAQRGVPGTHDMQTAIRDANAVLAGMPVALPQFDKALDQPQRVDCIITLDQQHNFASISGR
ncbi:hypothetical protein [Rheinheimera maricola]|uniref:Uncharacterized protein n=1 Tax=Rheinheimera maricola TaxID=2793282 RepID=A0ABS7XCC8_9GAMM|nr:hypothetical protein [Rheinheimera maricola]MBZ9613201.1 hypothetical protein [Rheinheimera maricola]